MRLIFLDIETNGLDPYRHNVVEIALRVLNERGEEQARFDSVVQLSAAEWEASDPESLQVNGFSWEKSQSGQSQTWVCEQIRTLFEALSIRRGQGAFFVCQNPSFDRQFFSKLFPVYLQEQLQWPYHWMGLESMYFKYRMERLQNHGEKIPQQWAISKNAIARYFNLPEEAHPHRAMNGVDHLILCYEKVTGWTPSPA